jgi:curli biogenesis system outer membrane secretion channel CsgG
MKQLILFVALLFFSAGAFAKGLPVGSKVAFLGLGFVDLSTEGAYYGKREDESRRLQLLERLIEQRFRDEGMNLVDLAPIAEKLASIANPGNCYGCDVRMARTLGADFVVVGAVHKVSNLIISMNLHVRDVLTGDVVRARAVDVRTNTDKSWTRGMKYILKTSIFKE